MRVNPVSALGRSIVKRKRPEPAETGTRPEAEKAFAVPVPVEPQVARDTAGLSARYLPNSIFLAHLIATRDFEPQTRFKRQTEPERGSESYRATAALPRQRAAGYLLSTSL